MSFSRQNHHGGARSPPRRGSCSSTTTTSGSGRQSKSTTTTSTTTTTSSSSTTTSSHGAAGVLHRRTTHGGIAARRGARSPAFREKLRQMMLPLAPLVQMTTGAVHPAFPTTLLKFWLLTERQLDDLAHFYHQRTPGPWTQQYPCPITWPAGLELEEKRRKMGKFIGLRGCTTPTAVCPPLEPACKAEAEVKAVPSPARRWLMSEADIVEDARQARYEEDADDAMRNKINWYR